MSKYEQIRALIPNPESAMKVGAIIKALPHIEPQYIRESIGQMYRPGILDRTGNRSDGYAYFVARDVKLKRYATDEERAAGKRASDAAHNRRRRGQTREERHAAWAKAREIRQRHSEAIQAERARKRAEKKASERTATTEAQEAKRKERAAVIRAQALKTKPQRMMSNAPARARLPHVTLPVKPMQRAETVAEWQMRTGQRPEVLPVAWDQRMAA